MLNDYKDLPHLEPHATMRSRAEACVVQRVDAAIEQSAVPSFEDAAIAPQICEGSRDLAEKTNNVAQSREIAAGYPLRAEQAFSASEGPNMPLDTAQLAHDLAAVVAERDAARRALRDLVAAVAASTADGVAAAFLELRGQRDRAEGLADARLAHNRHLDVEVHTLRQLIERAVKRGAIDELEAFVFMRARAKEGGGM
jgi:hypothetical protein